jgi:hypothetical protein
LLECLSCSLPGNTAEFSHIFLSKQDYAFIAIAKLIGKLVNGASDEESLSTSHASKTKL